MKKYVLYYKSSIANKFRSRKNLLKELKKKVCIKETMGNKIDFKEHRLPKVIKRYKEIEK